MFGKVKPLYATVFSYLTETEEKAREKQSRSISGVPTKKQESVWKRHVSANLCLCGMNHDLVWNRGKHEREESNCILTYTLTYINFAVVIILLSYDM